MRVNAKLSFDFLCKPNFILKKQELREGRVLSYWFLHIFLRGMFCSCTDENIMVSPWCIWLDYSGIQEDACSICWQCSERRVSGHAQIGIDLAACVTGALVLDQCFPACQIIPKNPKQIKRPAECLCNKCIIYGNLSWNWNHSYSWLHHVLMEHLLHEVHL